MMAMGLGNRNVQAMENQQVQAEHSVAESQNNREGSMKGLAGLWDTGLGARSSLLSRMIPSQSHTNTYDDLSQQHKACMAES